MTKVNFYLFEKSNERLVHSTSRLCRKILRQPTKIWLYCPDSELQQQLDDELWNFDACSFLPHGIDQQQAPICISAQLPEDKTWIVFNFDHDAIDPTIQFEHIIEIVENNEPAKVVGREKFKTYRQHGIQAKTYKL
ncbi:DNA polymerase III subunit chi [Acinetobacter rudis]|uniref:DNA polymerase III subunit chi n=1 Tax=Acinetobacter rudis TaxID=632955 RepID=A0AAW8J4S1_9GAMM|nr:DNA polymerase III subunit chi [Acinetobacter rudis]MDQ8934181.1 DNA polymerase III subunit chi [Acinetobacter rudis]MDQ8952662.1 DNA polymerase III subunit chi [Acinetobacter rudis]MDQ9016511.1 DNA polymerase III subunit chi [Acinetobacter rudis]